jgi:hypothetical protein
MLSMRGERGTTIVTALLDGRAMSAGELAAAARIAPPTASARLARISGAGLLPVERDAAGPSFGGKIAAMISQP